MAPRGSTALLTRRAALVMPILLIGLSTIAATGAVAQRPAGIIGATTDSLTGVPVVGVLVRHLRQDLYTVSNESGFFALRDLPPGYHLIQFSRLGYDDAVRYVRVGRDSVARISVQLMPRPVQLESITATSGKLDRDALRVAHTSGGFYRAFDRDDVLRSRARTALEFLDVGAGMPIRPCVKSDPDGGLCTILPFLPLSDLGRGGRVYNASGVAGGGFGARSRGVVGIAGIRRTVGPPVFLDDEYLPGCLNALALMGIADLERVETYGARGENHIRIYSSGYLELLATGQRRPSFTVPRLDYYQPSLWSDTISWRDSWDGAGSSPVRR